MVCVEAQKQWVNESFWGRQWVRAGMRMSTRQADSVEDDCDPVRAVESAAEMERHSGMKKNRYICLTCADFSFCMHSAGRGLLTVCLNWASASRRAWSSISSPIPETQTHLLAPAIHTFVSLFCLTLLKSLWNREREWVDIAEGMSDFLCNNPVVLYQYDPCRVFCSRISWMWKLLFFFCKPLAGVPTHLPSLVGCSNVFLTFGFELNSEESNACRFLDLLLVKSLTSGAISLYSADSTWSVTPFPPRRPPPSPHRLGR